MDKTKGQLLAHYAEKEPKTFWQYDGFVGQSADDYVMKADGDGDSIMWGVTQELMTGMYGVRVLVTAGTSQADAVRVLGKIREIIGHNGFAWQERGQAELTTELDGATRGERVAELRTEAHDTNEAHDWLCAICGEPFDVEPVSVFLAGHGGELCPRCILAGPEKAAEIMRHYAQSERERAARILDHAAELDALAERLPGATPWVTFDEWTEKVGAAYREDGRMDAKQLRKWQAEMTAYKAELAARV